MTLGLLSCHICLNHDFRSIGLWYPKQHVASQVKQHKAVNFSNSPACRMRALGLLEVLAYVLSLFQLRTVCSFQQKAQQPLPLKLLLHLPQAAVANSAAYSPVVGLKKPEGDWFTNHENKGSIINVGVSNK